MKPSSIPEVTNRDLYDVEQLHGCWLENGQCPEGTIPIRHAREGEYYAHRTVPPVALARRKELNVRVNVDTTGHEVYIYIYISYYKTTSIYCCLISHVLIIN
jgi:hypothetical protein